MHIIGRVKLFLWRLERRCLRLRRVNIILWKLERKSLRLIRSPGGEENRS